MCHSMYVRQTHWLVRRSRLCAVPAILQKNYKIEPTSIHGDTVFICNVNVADLYHSSVVDAATLIAVSDKLKHRYARMLTSSESEAERQRYMTSAPPDLRGHGSATRADSSSSDEAVNVRTSDEATHERANRAERRGRRAPPAARPSKRAKHADDEDYAEQSDESADADSDSE